MTLMRNAVLYADGITVCCPHCEADQPGPLAGCYADKWRPEELKAHDSEVLECVSCEKKFRLTFQNKAQISIPKDKANS
jgi:hypothetical protein